MRMQKFPGFLRAYKLSDGSNFPAKATTPWLFFGLVGLALSIASVAGAGLSWDGSYMLFKLLDEQKPFVVHNRWFVALLQLPTILVSQFTGNLLVLQTIFGLSYALVPFVSLLLCWWMVRSVQPGLFVWAALGIGLLTLPGQFFLVSDGIMTLQLGWPIFLAILTGLNRAKTIVIGVLAVAAFLDHPIAALLFIFAIGLSFIRSWRVPAERKEMYLVALGFGLLTGLAILKLLLLGTNYEEEQLTVGELQREFAAGVGGYPLFALILGWLVGGLVLVSAWSGRRWLRVGIGLGLIIATVLLAIWANDPHLWSGTPDFRIWASFLAVPLIGLAALDSLGRPTARPDWTPRFYFIGLIGGLFLVVLTLQSLAWANLTNDLRQAIAQNPAVCVTTASINDLRAETPLGHWSISAYSLLFNDNTPQKIVLSEARCGDKQIDQSVKLVDWESSTWHDGWFHTQPLRQKLVAEQQANLSCHYQLGAGWYEREQTKDGKDWWYWNGGTGQLQIYSPTDTQAVLNGTMRSFQVPNGVQLQLNGQNRAVIAVNWNDLRAFQPLTLPLKKGWNDLTFVSSNPAIKPPTDPRRLAVVVGDINLTTADKNAATCAANPIRP